MNDFDDYKSLSVVDALHAPNKGVVVFLDYEKSRAYLSYTHSTVSFLMRNIQQLRDGTHPNQMMQDSKDRLEFLVFEDCDPYTGNMYGRYRLGYWKTWLTSRGWVLMNEVKPLELEPRLVIETNSVAVRSVFATVYLKDKNNRRFRVQDFKDLSDAEHYLSYTDLDLMVRTAFKKEE